MTNKCKTEGHRKQALAIMKGKQKGERYDEYLTKGEYCQECKTTPYFSQVYEETTWNEIGVDERNETSVYETPECCITNEECNNHLPYGEETFEHIEIGLW